MNKGHDIDLDRLNPMVHKITCALGRLIMEVRRLEKELKSRGAVHGPPPDARESIPHLYVDWELGSDTAGCGSASMPYQTIQKAMDEAPPGLPAFIFVKVSQER